MTDHNQRDRESLACDFVAEMAQHLIVLASAMLASACAADMAAVEADLWSIRRTLITAIETWREAAPGLGDDGGAHG